MNLLKYILVISLFLIFGCEKNTVIREEIIIKDLDDPPMPCISTPAPIYHPGEMLYGQVSGLKNCLPFMASGRLLFFTINNKAATNLYISTFQIGSLNDYYNKENLTVGVPGQSEGTYSMYFPFVDEYSAHYSTVQDGHVFEDIFRIDEDYDSNEITLTLVDKSAKRAQGFFNCRFLIYSAIPSGRNPDTVTFTNCYFDVWEK